VTTQPLCVGQKPYEAVATTALLPAQLVSTSEDMRPLLHLNPMVIAEVLRVWGVAVLVWLAHARLGRCSICHTTLRVDDRLALLRHRVAHAECATLARSWDRPLRSRSSRRAASH
jgi:hypothetical protein